MSGGEAHELAERFWILAGEREPFPRSLEQPVLWSLPVAVFKLPRLGLDTVRAWLHARGVEVALPHVPQRMMRGFVLAQAGNGIIFVDANDPLEEQRFSFAHEVAHFLVDYLWLRQKALAVLGEAVQEVLDGLRPPTPAERLTSVLRAVPLGLYTHLLDRPTTGQVASNQVADAEDRADGLALELLAPQGEVVRMLYAMAPQHHGPAAEDACSEILRTTFGLPAMAAASYARSILWRRAGNRSTREWLGL